MESTSTIKYRIGILILCRALLCNLWLLRVSAFYWAHESFPRRTLGSFSNHHHKLSIVRFMSIADLESEDALYQQLIQRPAHQLKQELQLLQLDIKGRKPDLARRLALYKTTQQHETPQPSSSSSSSSSGHSDVILSSNTNPNFFNFPTFFASLSLSRAAQNAIQQAGFQQPTPIQTHALPHLFSSSDSVILHAETGSGKTLCYLLPITERAWKSMQPSNHLSSSKFTVIQSQYQNTEHDDDDDDIHGLEYAIILTPNRELATQVASVAQILAPPGSVRLIPYPTNLVRESYALKERGTLDTLNDSSSMTQSRVRILIGSAQTIYTSLFGSTQNTSASSSTNSNIPQPGRVRRFLEDTSSSTTESSYLPNSSLPPTSKPEAQLLLRKVSYLVLDEVDRLLLGTTHSSYKSKYYKKHEKPAAVLTSTMTRQTLGQVQLVAVSATVGRPLRRELARVLGVPPNQCPTVITSSIQKFNNDDDDNDHDDDGHNKEDTVIASRLITVPSSVKHYVLPCDGSTSANLVTTAAFFIKTMASPPTMIQQDRRRILLVITNDCGIQVNHVVGALRHFGLQPEPLTQSLYAHQTDALIQNHEQISKCTGLGQSNDNHGYLLVTNEQDIRGLHLDLLDTVVIVGRPKGPDEYIHISGRTGRGGNKGQVINVLSYEQAQALTSWEKMLNLNFIPIEQSDARSLD